MLNRKTVTFLVNRYLSLCPSYMFKDNWEAEHKRDCDALINAYFRGDRLAALQINELAQHHGRTTA